MMLEEIQHCIKLAKQNTSGLSHDEQEHVNDAVDRYNYFFSGNTNTLAVRTHPQIPLNNDELQSYFVMDAFENLDWQKLATQLRLKLKLPHPITCIEHFYGRPFPITDDNGNITINLIGCVLFAKQSLYNNKDAIEFELTNLCTTPNEPDKVVIFNSTAQFMITSTEGVVVGCSRNNRQEQWHSFHSRTAESLAFMQIISLLMLNQINNSEGYQANHYELI